MDKDLLVGTLRSLPAILYVATCDELTFVELLRKLIPKKGTLTHVFNSERGVMEITTYLTGLGTRTVRVKEMSFREAFQEFPEVPDERLIRVVLDADRWLADPDAHRLLRNHVQQRQRDLTTVAMIILVGTKDAVPEPIRDICRKLDKRMDPTVGMILDHLKTVEAHLGDDPDLCTSGAAEELVGLSIAQIDALVSQWYVDKKAAKNKSPFKFTSDDACFYRGSLWPRKSEEK